MARPVGIQSQAKRCTKKDVVEVVGAVGVNPAVGKPVEGGGAKRARTRP